MRRAESRAPSWVRAALVTTALAVAFAGLAPTAAFPRFNLDRPPGTTAPDVTSNAIAFEVNAYTDWKLNQNLTLSLVSAYGDPGRAVQQTSGRTTNFVNGIVYLAYNH